MGPVLKSNELMSEWWGGLLLSGYQECGSSGSKSTDTGYRSTFRIYWMWAITVELRKQKLIDCLLIVWIIIQLKTYRHTHIHHYPFFVGDTGYCKSLNIHFVCWIHIETYNICLQTGSFRNVKLLWILLHLY